MVAVQQRKQQRGIMAGTRHNGWHAADTVAGQGERWPIKARQYAQNTAQETAQTTSATHSSPAHCPHWLARWAKKNAAQTAR